MKLVAGVDEVGRGPLAGPVVACALILPKGHSIVGLKDSKKLSKKRRSIISHYPKAGFNYWYRYIRCRYYRSV